LAKKGKNPKNACFYSKQPELMKGVPAGHKNGAGASRLIVPSLGWLFKWVSFFLKKNKKHPPCTFR
jgi:hypothetical protein